MIYCREVPRSLRQAAAAVGKWRLRCGKARFETSGKNCNVHKKMTDEDGLNEKD